MRCSLQCKGAAYVVYIHVSQVTPSLCADSFPYGSGKCVSAHAAMIDLKFLLTAVRKKRHMMREGRRMDSTLAVESSALR